LSLSEAKGKDPIPFRHSEAQSAEESHPFT